MNIQMRNHKLLTQTPGELEHALKCRCNQSCTLDDIANTLQDFKYNPRERVEEVTKKKNSCHNCGSTNHYANNCPKAKKKVYAIEKVLEEESPTGDSESDSMGDSIREKSDEDQDPREEFLVEYQEETLPELQDIQLEAAMPQDTAKKNLCKHTQDAQTFLVTPTKGMVYIHGTATKMTVCIDNSQHPLIIYSGEHCSRLARNYLDHHFPNWENQLLPTKAKNFKSASGKMTPIGTTIKEIIIPRRKGNIRLNPKFFVLKDAHIQETWEDPVQYIDRVLSKCTPINQKISLKKCNFCQQQLLALGHKVSGLSLAIDQKRLAVLLLKSVPKNIKEMQSFLGFASYYRNHIQIFAHITSSLHKLCSKDVVFEITKERRYAYERIQHQLPNAPLLILPDFELPFKIYIAAEGSQDLGEALHQRQILDGEPREGVICYISRQLTYSEASYESTQT
ncbi:hypothetical protein O181_043743 [Austropuccinia psidii MF-1]|uniref:CCHC-type domain-containing protein n=1 Tax=Austropuccinia psidii MF-1 TaxID=1389203 RepID=A0A9Q3DNS0_9BASI|nr:hypothetical protein [Austropuccinia psidii MF-1]